MAQAALTLPVELIECTVDYLYDEERALKRCALVSRNFLPRSRYHLFRRVDLPTTDRCRRFSTVLDSSPGVADLVSELCLSQMGKRWIEQGELMRLEHARLRRLRTLSLAFLTWAAVAPATRTLFRTLFSDVTRLDLWKCSFATEADLRALLGCFPRLASLSLRMTRVEAPTRDRALAPRVPVLPLLGHISLGDRDCVTVLADWLRLGYLEASAPETLEVHGVGQQEIVGLSDLLSGIGPSLKTFAFTMDYFAGNDGGKVFDDFPWFTDTTKLHTLHMGVRLHIRSAQQNLREPLAWVPILLAQLDSSDLREIKLDLGWSGTFGRGLTRGVLESCLDWAAIESILLREQLSGLRRVHVCLKGAMDDASTWRGMLPRLHERGLLEIEIKSDLPKSAGYSPMGVIH